MRGATDRQTKKGEKEREREKGEERQTDKERGRVTDRQTESGAEREKERERGEREGGQRGRETLTIGIMKVYNTQIFFIAQINFEGINFTAGTDKTDKISCT